MLFCKITVRDLEKREVCVCVCVWGVCLCVWINGAYMYCYLSQYTQALKHFSCLCQLHLLNCISNTWKKLRYLEPHYSCYCLQCQADDLLNLHRPNFFCKWGRYHAAEEISHIKYPLLKTRWHKRMMFLKLNYFLKICHLKPLLLENHSHILWHSPCFEMRLQCLDYIQQDRQCIYTLTLWCICATIIALKKQ